MNQLITFRTDPHSPPSDVQIVHVGRREATITWQLPVFEDQNGAIVYATLLLQMAQSIAASVSWGLLAEEYDPLRHMIEERSREKLSLHWSQLMV